jgi:agmatinase
MEIVECSPPYDNAEITSLLGVRVICDVLATLVNHSHLPKTRASVDGAVAKARAT